MNYELFKTTRNVRIITDKEVNEGKTVPITIIQPKKVIPKYYLSTETIQTSLVTTNGFKPNSIQTYAGVPKPELSLVSFVLENDEDNQIISELKQIYAKSVQFIIEREFEVIRGIISETPLYDNEFEQEFSFTIDLFLSHEIEFNDLFILEEDLWNYMEKDEDSLSDHQKKINFIISILNYGAEEVTL
jgi:hypothetical protein